VVVTPDPAPPLAATQPAEPAPKLLHPWKRAWSVRRQRELVGAA
jgi:hypothetical protein